MDKLSKEEENARWSEVMKLAREYAFIVQAYGDVAVLADYDNQRDGQDLEIGQELTFYRLICPHCDASEEMDPGSCLQYDQFRLVMLNDEGSERVWRCLKCMKRFMTIIE